MINIKNITDYTTVNKLTRSKIDTDFPILKQQKPRKGQLALTSST